MEKRCTRCYYGTISNGVCSNCQQPEQTLASRNANALPLNARLHDRYQIGDVLGSGGFGITYAAWDERENRRVALKELFPIRDVSRLPDRCTVKVVRGQEEYFSHVSNCFMNEAMNLVNFQGQPGIVSFYNLFDENNTLYYAMEYLDGLNLRDYLQRSGPMEWERLSVMIRPVMYALELLHARNFIHRDISPDNIFLTRDGQARLIDFGSVRTYTGVKSFTTFIKRNFAPWEQYQTDGNQGPWTDVYALCVTIYYTLTGILPPIASDRRMRDTTVSLTTLCPKVPYSVAAAIHKGMAVNIADRYSSVQQLERAIYGGTSAPQQNSSGQQPATQLPRGATLVCTKGYYSGRQWQLNNNTCLRFGRQTYCEIRYPSDARFQPISGLHCSVQMNASGQIMVRDEKSRNGTWLDGTPLSGGVWYWAGRGCCIRFLGEEYLIR